MMDDEELTAAEEARDRRRDRRSEAHERDLMRSGSAKVFKQILDAQEKRARADEDDGADEEGRRDGHARHREHRDGSRDGRGDERDR